MRALFWGLLGVYLGVVALVTRGFPARVPIHFDVHGYPDRFASRLGAGWTLGLVGLGLGLLLAGAAELSSRLPMSLINVPDKQWWARPENRSELTRLMRTDLYVIGVATLVMLVLMVGLTARAAHADPPHLSAWSWALLAAYVCLVIAYAARMRRRYRRPE